MWQLDRLTASATSNGCGQASPRSLRTTLELQQRIGLWMKEARLSGLSHRGKAPQLLPPRPCRRMKSAALLAVALLCCANVASARLFSSPEEWKGEARRNLQGESRSPPGTAICRQLSGSACAFESGRMLVTDLGRPAYLLVILTPCATGPPLLGQCTATGSPCCMPAEQRQIGGWGNNNSGSHSAGFGTDHGHEHKGKERLEWAVWVMDGNKDWQMGRLFSWAC